MNTIKSIISQIISIAILLLIILTDYLNPIKEYLPILWTLIIMWSIFYSIKYRKGLIPNEIRFFTNNDDYNKIYPFIIGTLLLIGGICAMLLLQKYLIFISLMTINGFLLIISGIFFIPNGLIWIKHNKLNSTSGNQKNSIQIDKVNKVKLHQDKIVFIDQKENKYHLDHLKLNTLDHSKLKDFLNAKLNPEIEIKTYGNKTYT